MLKVKGIKSKYASKATSSRYFAEMYSYHAPAACIDKGWIILVKGMKQSGFDELGNELVICPQLFGMLEAVNIVKESVDRVQKETFVP